MAESRALEVLIGWMRQTCTVLGHRLPENSQDQSVMGDRASALRFSVHAPSAADACRFVSAAAWTS